MKNCILVSTTNSKGFGLDSVKFLIDNTPYEYEVSGAVRSYVEKLAKFKIWKALIVTKKNGTLINRDLINE